MELIKTLNKLKELLKEEHLFVEDGMAIMIKFCEEIYPHSDWSKFKKINYEKEKGRLEFWLKKVIKYEPIPNNVNGLWFGIFNPVIDNYEKTITSSDFYICGNPDFTKDDMEWSCGPVYFPNDRYADSNTLAEIYKKAYTKKSSLRNNAEYPLCLSYTALVLKEILDYIPTSLFLKNTQNLGIMAGFDSGDFVYIGEITSEGFIQ